LFLSLIEEIFNRLVRTEMPGYRLNRRIRVKKFGLKIIGFQGVF